MNAKKKVYFSGSIRGGREDAGVYEAIIAGLKKKYVVLTEHIGRQDVLDMEKDETNEEIYLRDKKLMDECDLLIAEATTASLGVGYELAYAEKMKKPVIVLFNIGANKKLSAMISGDEYFKKIYYSGLEELKDIVNKL